MFRACSTTFSRPATFMAEARRIENSLKEQGIPMLTIETDYSQEDVEQIRTRVEAFLEMIVARRRE